MGVGFEIAPAYISHVFLSCFYRSSQRPGFGLSHPGGMVWLYGMVRGKNWAAGLGLAMTIIRPQITLILAVPFLFNRRKVWWWFAAVATLMTLFSIGLVGLSGAKDFINLMVISAGGQGYGLAEASMFDFTGMVLRLFREYL